MGYSEVPWDFNIKFDIKAITEDIISKKKGSQISASDILFKSNKKTKSFTQKGIEWLINN